MDETCVFCRIVAGAEPAAIVAADGRCTAFLPRPQGWFAPGHVLVTLDRHVVDVFDATTEDLGATIAMVKRVAGAIRRELGAGGVNIMNASGPDSEQSIFHLHFHVLPRWADDGPTTWPARRIDVPVPPDFAERLRLALA